MLRPGQHGQNLQGVGFINYELLYTGSNASGINLTYREFSPEGLARVAFFQNLTYPADARSITFKQLRIRVERASADAQPAEVRRLVRYRTSRYGSTAVDFLRPGAECAGREEES